MAEAKPTSPAGIMKRRKLVECESLFLDGSGNSFVIREDERALTNHSTPESELDRAERLREVESSLERLDKREQEILDRHWRNGESFAEIGAAYGISKQRAFQLEVASRKKLRSMLQK
jgi:RNA polymerase sigma factor (sigma-70 family)